MAKSILIITPRVPYPLKDGGALAMYQCIEMYKQLGHEVHVLSINTRKHWVNESDYPLLFNQLESFETISVNTNVKIGTAFINLFSNQSYNITRFIDKNFEEKLKEKLQKDGFDIIQFESIYTAPYLATARELSQACMICRVHNIEHDIWRHIASHEKGIFKKRYLKLLSDRLEKYELEKLSKFDILLNISELEGKALNKKGIKTMQYHLPYGIEKPRFQSKQIAQEFHSVYHLGSMDWLPNQEGVQWFIQRVWPIVLQDNDNIKFYIAGRNMPRAFNKYSTKTIKVEGEVEDMYSFSLSKNIMIIPLLSGAGIRIKVLEAMMLGKTIISTTIGVRGFDLQDKKTVLIANSPEEFAKKINWCMIHKTEAAGIGKAAQEFALTHYDKRNIYRKWNDFVTKNINREQ